MSDLFDNDEANLSSDEESFESADELNISMNKNSTLDARRRLESILEEKRLRNELRDELDEDDDAD